MYLARCWSLGSDLLCDIARNKLQDVRQVGLMNRLDWGNGELRGPELAGEEGVLPSAIIQQRDQPGVGFIGRDLIHPLVSLLIGKQESNSVEGRGVIHSLLSWRKPGFRFGVPVV